MQEKQKIAGVNRNVFFLGLVSFFNDFSAEMVQSVMPLFLTTVLKAPAAAVGIIEGTADALASVLKLFSGWLSDRVRKRKSLAIVGYAISVAVRPFLALATAFSQVFALRVVDRIGKGIRDAPRDALLAESVSREELGRSFGFHRSMDTLGATVGPLFAFFALGFLNNDYRALFLIAFVIGIGALFSFFFVQEPKERASEGHSQRQSLDWQLFRTHKRFVLVVFSIFIFGLGTLPIALVLLKANEAGFGGAKFPLVYFIYNFTFVLTAIPLGKFADVIGERVIIAAGFLAAACAYFGLAGAYDPLSLVLFFLLLGLYSAATDGLTRVLAVKAVPRELLATGQGFMNMAIGFSSLGAGIIGGLLWTNYSSAAALHYAGVFSLLGFGLFLFMTSNHIFTPLDPKSFGLETGDGKRISLKPNKSPARRGGDLTGFTSRHG